MFTLTLLHPLSGMSLEQLEELAVMARTEGHGKQGRSRSRAENVTALRHLAQYEQLGLSHDAAVKATSKAELASPTTIRAVLIELASEEREIKHTLGKRCLERKCSC